MCGIFCSICRIEHNDGRTTNIDSDWTLCEGNVHRRGPDIQSKCSETINEKWKTEFFGSVLWMQGTNPVTQPCVDDEGNILLWNGDIFSGSLENGTNSDTLTVMEKLKSCENVLETLRLIQGPFSFIYLQKSLNRIYFGRDFIGRHSLLMSISQEKNTLTLSSVSCKKVQNIFELPAVGIFSVNLESSEINLSCNPWETLDNRSSAIINAMKDRFSIDIAIGDVIFPPKLSLQFTSDPQLEDLSLFDNISTSENYQDTMELLLKNPKIHERVCELLGLLKQSVQLRIQKKPSYCKICLKSILQGQDLICSHAKIGVLFSGGLDSTILAAIANEFVPKNESIDLINVAFEKVVNVPVGNSKNKKAVRNNSTECPPKFDVPDRKTGREALIELTKLFPSRTWNFVESDVTREELFEKRSQRICNLVYPLRTVLDESLGCAVWFAARGIGKLFSNNQQYESTCRILLLGMGADELFGGYTRHRTTLRRNGWKALIEELDTELSRISERNLGRDDRVICDHGRQSRLPYLDENFVDFVRQIPPWERCYPTEKMPQGLGDKLLLRLLAYKIGLKKTSTFPKRAFQFGSRIANSKENAKDISRWM